MERLVAIKTLRGILGKSMGYRVDTSAPCQDERDAARAKLLEVVAERKALSEKMEERKQSRLNSDKEYGELRAAYDAARSKEDRLRATTHHYRFTVGKTDSMFFFVKAQGDSWEEVIAKLRKA